MDNNHNISIKDIAKMAGISTASVSRILNKKGRYSKETEEKVLKIVADYNYVSNKAAKSIRTLKSGTVGLIIPNIQNEFFATLARFIEEYFYEQDYSVFICNTSNQPEKEKDYFKRLQSQAVDGIIVISCLASITQNLVRKNTPLVCLDRTPANEMNLPKIKSNDYQGICDSTQLLIDKGCRNLVYIDSNVPHTDTRSRVDAFKDTLNRNDMVAKPEIILKGNPHDSSLIQGEVLVGKYIENGGVIDGIVCSNDSAAVGALYAIKRHDLEVPGQVKIIGFDNSLQSRITNPSLSTVSRSPELLATNAATILMDLIDHKIPAVSEIEIATHVIEREST